jgi:hypothetical protein
MLEDERPWMTTDYAIKTSPHTTNVAHEHRHHILVCCICVHACEKDILVHLLILNHLPLQWVRLLRPLILRKVLTWG